MSRVTVVCPTFQRHRYIDLLVDQFKNQDYDASLMTMIILDDSPDAYPFVIDDKRVEYIHDTNKTMLWQKRNKLNELSKGEIIVCMDDDDIYFNNRVSHAVERLTSNPKIKLAGCSSLYIHDLCTNKLHFFKAKMKGNLLNGTFAYRKELLKTNKYSSTPKNYNEESTFTKKFSTPYVLLDCDKTIVCVSHGQNTVAKEGFCHSDSECKTTKLNYPKDILLKFFHANPMIYWINMDKDRNRYESMINQLKTYKYHKHVSGFTEPSLLYDTKTNSKEEACCLSSHLEALRVFTCDECNREYAVICEDDINFKDIRLFGERIHYYLKSAPTDWEILQLFSIEPITTSYEKCDSNSITTWKKWGKTNFSTMIYVIKRNAAKRILQRVRSNHYQFLKSQCVADIVIYKWCTTYTIQLPFFQEAQGFGSSIHVSHVPYHVKHNTLLQNKLISLDLKYPFRHI